MPNFKGKSGGGPSAMKKYGMGKSPIQFQGYSGGTGLDSDLKRKATVMDEETGIQGSSPAEKSSPAKAGWWTAQTKGGRAGDFWKTSQGGGGGAARTSRRRR